MKSVNYFFAFCSIPAHRQKDTHTSDWTEVVEGIKPDWPIAPTLVNFKWRLTNSEVNLYLKLGAIGAVFP